MKSVTAVIQQTLYLFLQNSNYCHYWQNTTHLLLFIGLGFANYLTFSECLGMILQDNTHVCYYHWGFQAMIQSWVLCVWTDQLRAKKHMRSDMRDRHIHMIQQIKHSWWTWTWPQKNNHVIYELWTGIVRLSGFDSFTLTTPLWF